MVVTCGYIISDTVVARFFEVDTVSVADRVVVLDGIIVAGVSERDAVEGVVAGVVALDCVVVRIFQIDAPVVDACVVTDDGVVIRIIQGDALGVVTSVVVLYYRVAGVVEIDPILGTCLADQA